MNLFAMMTNADGKIVNYDEVKQIHYGVINQNDCSGDAIDDIYNQGDDLYYADALEECKRIVAEVLEETNDKTLEEIKEAIVTALPDESHRFVDRLLDCICYEEDLGERKVAAESYIDDEFGQYYESDTTAYAYEKDGYIIRLNTDDGDMFVVDSPYFTYCGQCSPCAPNAGYLTDRREMFKTFCLGVDWFEDETAPYDIYEVSTGELIYKYKGEDEE